jgi:cytochrome c oxidase subunit IV
MSAATLSPKTYVLVWVVLMLLMALTWTVAEFDLGIVNSVAAVVIAIIKMCLVILFFMHVRYNSRLTWVFAAAGFVWLTIMITLTMNDYLTRGSVAGRRGTSWEHGAWPAPTKELPGPAPGPTIPSSQ